jgi:CHAD domain-containing protein
VARRRRPAGEVLAAHLAEQTERVRSLEPAVRDDQPEAVHDMRVATRRLRSALRTFRPLVDADAARALRAELRWLGGLLGAARDAEVLRARVVGAARAQDGDLLLGPVVQRLDDELTTTYRAALEDVWKALDSERFRRLLTSLDALAAAPPARPAALRPAPEVLPRRVRSAWRAVRRAHRAVGERGGDDAAVHALRKAAKRARYAAEVAVPVHGADAEALAGALRDLQDLLGEQHDSVVARELLRRTGIEAHLAGENGFSFGRLHALEERRGDDAAARLDALWDRVSRRRLRAWLR